MAKAPSRTPLDPQKFYEQLIDFIDAASLNPGLANVVNDARALAHRMVRDCYITEDT